MVIVGPDCGVPAIAKDRKERGAGSSGYVHWVRTYCRHIEITKRSGQIQYEGGTGSQTAPILEKDIHVADTLTAQNVRNSFFEVN